MGEDPAIKKALGLEFRREEARGRHGPCSPPPTVDPLVLESALDSPRRRNMTRSGSRPASRRSPRGRQSPTAKPGLGRKLSRRSQASPRGGKSSGATFLKPKKKS